MGDHRTYYDARGRPQESALDAGGFFFVEVSILALPEPARRPEWTAKAFAMPPAARPPVLRDLHGRKRRRR